MNVDRGQYRFRILNGSNSRFYTIGFSNGMSFIQIGSDGGYLQSPTLVTSLLIAPAERVDIIVDFSTFRRGERIQLLNSAITTNTSGVKQTLGQIMQFTSTDQQGPDHSTSPPHPTHLTLHSQDHFSLPCQPQQNKEFSHFTRSQVGPNGSASQALLDGQNMGRCNL